MSTVHGTAAGRAGRPSGQPGTEHAPGATAIDNKTGVGGPGCVYLDKTETAWGVTETNGRGCEQRVREKYGGSFCGRERGQRGRIERVRRERRGVRGSSVRRRAGCVG